MPRCRFVDPSKETRLSLSGDDWIDVRWELTAGQRRAMFTTMRHDGVLEPAEYGRARALAYLLRWSFTDRSGAVAPISEGALDFLEPEALEELVAVIDTHIEAVSAEKKMLSGATNAAAILVSVS